MYKDKGIITDDEQLLIARYPKEIQEKLKNHLLRCKTWDESCYQGLIDSMETGREISCTITENNVEAWTMGAPNISRLVRRAIEMELGTRFEPTDNEIKFDDRLEEYQSYPRGTRIKPNGEVIYREK